MNFIKKAPALLLTIVVIISMSITAFAQVSIKGYFRNKLDKSGKLYYDALESEFTKIKKGGQDNLIVITRENIALNGGSAKTIVDKEMQKIFNAYYSLRGDQPSLFYWNDQRFDIAGEYSEYGDNISIKFNLVVQVLNEYKGKSSSNSGMDGVYTILNEKDISLSKAYQSADKIVAEANKLPNDYEKVKYLNDKVCELTSYDFASAESNSTYNSSQEAEKVFLGKPVVCAGYAKAFKYLCDKANIPCFLARGTGVGFNNTSGPHMWNYVFVDGAWYLVDTTWNDSRGNHDYLLKGSASTKNTHKEKNQSNAVPNPGVKLSSADYVYNKSTAKNSSADKNDKSTDSQPESPVKGNTVSLKDMQEAVAKAKGDTISIGNASVISKDALVYAGNANKTLIIDTLNGKSFAGRITLEPKDLKNASSDLSTAVLKDTENTDKMEARYQKYTGGSVMAINTGKNPDFNMRICVKLDEKIINRDNLHFYLHNSEKNTYSVLTNTNYSIDKDGFLHFSVNKSGDIIIASSSIA